MVTALLVPSPVVSYLSMVASVGEPGTITFVYMLQYGFELPKL